MIEAILGGAAPVVLGAALPIVAGLLFNYLATGFLVTVVLPAILGVLGINLAAFLGGLAVVAGDWMGDCWRCWFSGNIISRF